MNWIGHGMSELRSIDPSWLDTRGGGLYSGQALGTPDPVPCNAGRRGRAHLLLIRVSRTSEAAISKPHTGVDPTRPGRLLSAALLAAAAGVVGLLAVRSLGWPLFHDAPLMHYVAWRILEGDVPYRDLFDMNFPGTYLLHLGVVGLLGSGDGAWRVFDLGWLAATVGAIAWYGRPFGARAAWLGGLLYAGYHLSAGPVQAGQRDFLLLLPLFLALGWTARHWETGRWGDLMWAGLAMGVAAILKPTPVLLWAALGLGASIPAYRRGDGVWEPPALMLAAGLIPVAGAGLWLAWLGALRPFEELLVGYVLPIYSRIGRVGLVGYISPRHWAFVALTLGVGALAAWRAWASGGLGPRRGLLILGIAYGGLHYVAQGKGWGYHLVPLVAFGGSLAASWIEDAREERRWVAGMMAAGLALLLVATGLKGYPNHGLGPEVRRRIAQEGDLEAAAAACGAGGQSVQALDTAHGAIHALLNAHIAQPTRFIYDFPFFHAVDQPYVSGLRQELIGGLQHRPPACIILMEEGWPDGGYERFTQFEALAALLVSDYRLSQDREGYRIYARRED